jgi:hypothetical protein
VLAWCAVASPLVLLRICHAGVWILTWIAMASWVLVGGRKGLEIEGAACAVARSAGFAWVGCHPGWQARLASLVPFAAALYGGHGGDLAVGTTMRDGGLATLTSWAVRWPWLGAL